MVDIFDEVDEDIRAERMGRFARRYGAVVIAFAVLLVVAVALWQVWLWHRGKQNERAADAFIAALDHAAAHGSAASRTEIAGQFAAVAKTAPQGYATLARLNQASLLADSGHLKQALTLWETLMSDGSINPALRDVAILGWASHVLGTAEPSLIQAKLETLAAEGNPWRPIALQYLALLDIRTGDKAGAIKTFKSVANDVSTPADMRNMANGMAEALGAPPSAN